ncbi:HEAT repeat domain-containing protein [Gloeobacter kilaueensis]|uniref:Oxidoreductase/HEAT repeat-containing protein n=1 Tax=Gloeobacter kilaueensis (strain ATCC BAA-2537 / CCAP 1431/1 / ULC 316 / JS1) TaxID=1183438 RepID=U5QLP2_GLOK1|nr:HEAT repeat domain-containing protein [Gloeobacter kilaueensis]AGY58534.1 oxidoreductase/HEAT repeat-containing protein [Gloeobacter kilaueensis JS1]
MNGKRNWHGLLLALLTTSLCLSAATIEVKKSYAQEATTEMLEPSLQNLRKSEPSSRIAAVSWLGSIRPINQEAVDALIKTLDTDPDSLVRANAALAMGFFAAQAPDNAVDALSAAALKNEDTSVRANALSALGNIGLPARKAISAVKMLTHSSDPVIRSEAIQTLKVLQEGGCIPDSDTPYPVRYRQESCQ